MKDDNKELTYEQKHVALMESEVMALESIANALTQIAYTLSTNSTAVSALRTAVASASASAQQTVEAQTPAPVTPAPAQTPAPAPVTPASAPAQTPAPVIPAQTSDVTLDDLRNACLAATARNASAKNSIRALLTDRYHVANISKLDPSLYAQVKTEVDSL